MAISFVLLADEGDLAAAACQPYVSY